MHDHVQDAARSLDPTGTAYIRRSFRADLGRRWQLARGDVLRAVGSLDVFGLYGHSEGRINALAAGAAPLDAFRKWFEGLLRKEVIEPGLGRYINWSYRIGTERAAKLLNRPVQNYPQGGTAALTVAANAELEGIVQTVIQQAVRMMMSGMAAKQRPMMVARRIVSRIDAVGIARSKALASVAVVQAHAHATLDQFEMFGVKQVGLIPEHHTKTEVTDAKRKKKPSKSKVSRIRRAENKITKLGSVNVLTAGDDDVCEVCEEIAAAGPYRINTARQLIPAHPNCRCAFVPADDKRFRAA